MGHETRSSFIHPFRVSVSSSLMGTVPNSEDMPDATLLSLSSQGLHSGGGGRQDQNEIKVNEVVRESKLGS